MTDLELYKHTDDWVAMVEPVVDLSNKLAQTPFAGPMRGKPADVFGCILYGRELGLSPLQSLQLINVIQGRPTLGSEGLRALYLGQGHRIWPVEWDEKKCTVRAERGDGRGAVDVTYTIKDATEAGLLKNSVWRTFPKQMLLARATSMAIKAIAPDVALGLEAADSPMVEQRDRPTGQASTVVQLAPAGPEAGVEPAAPEPADDKPRDVIPVDATGPEPITPAQLRKLGAQIGEWERLVNDGRRLSRDERRGFIAEMVGHPHLLSAKDLTKAEGSTAIEALDSLIVAALGADPATGEIVDAELVDEVAP